MDREKKHLTLQGFTFVELIVIITILAILATISFFSFQGYTQKTRDSARLVSISDITQALESYKIKALKYPTPENIYATGVIVGKDLFQVGEIGETLSTLLKFDKTPLDPLAKVPFAYGLSLDNKYFQVAGTLEGTVAGNTFSQTYARIEQQKAKVEGNYKGILTFSTSSGKYIANVPSLIFSRTGSYNLIQPNLVDDPYFIVDNGKNLPYSLDGETSLHHEGTADILKQLTGQNLSLTGVVIGDWSTNSGNLVSIIGYPKDQIGYEVLGNEYVMSGEVEVEKNLSLSCDILKNIQTNNSWSSTAFLPLVNRYVFNPRYGAAGYELWATDGTSSGTFKLRNLRLGSWSTFEFNGKYYFNGKLDTSPEFELWATDGTASGTYMVKDINPGTSNSSSPSEYKIFNNKLYFSATNGTDGQELWTSDGTASGTYMVKDIYSGALGGSPYLRYGAELNGKYLFRANTASGNELWITDGTSSGTYFVKDIYPGTESGLGATAFINFNGKVYFTGKDGPTESHNQVWSTDGTSSGTTKVTTTLTLTGGLGSYGSASNYTIFNNELYFKTNDPLGGYLYKLDSGGTLTKLKTFSQSLEILQEHNGYLYLTANDGTTGTELWRTDGTVIGTTQVKDISDATSASTPPSIMGIINNKLYLLGKTNSSISHNNLYVSDGTPTGTQILKIFHPSGGGAYYGKFISILGTFLFGADDGTNNVEFWTTKGDEASTKKVDVTYDSVTPTQIYTDKIFDKISNKILFFAEDVTNGKEIWSCSY